ncbi:MAG: prolipoprotein diacylglyceryl transferase [Acidimicrobiia bacterium]
MVVVADGLLASIPSPSDGVLHLGPVPLHMYGLMIALGVVVAAKVGRTRYIRKDPEADEATAKARGEAFDSVAFWAVVGGIIGARLYHVITDYQLFEGHWERTVQIWKGGLGIWGGVVGGALAVAVVARRRHLVFADIADSIVPGLAFAQAIGRWGNWFNQELFGGPSSLPWAVEIDRAHRPIGYKQYATFQPTFLYESLWCVALGFALLWVDRRYRLARGQLFALYAAGYTFFRFFMEEMRIDPAHTIGPLRVNAWVSIGVFVFSVAVFVALGRRARAQRAEGVDAAPTEAVAP